MTDFSLYIHFPWCIKKCPYCDFNSHVLHGAIPEEMYINALIEDITYIQPLLEHRTLRSIFMGGGTPSLFSPGSIARLLHAIDTITPLGESEITLEANPGVLDLSHLEGYYNAGINRLSLGVQSFDDTALKNIGRVHNTHDTQQALDVAIKLFKRINIDIMFGLPTQSVSAALHDLTMASNYPIEHLSWYQLTIEAETHFAKKPPLLPDSDTMETIYNEGIALLADHGFAHYEISAYTRHTPSLHNLNYWSGGDYIGIGAGAHSKWTHHDTLERWSLWRSPQKYLKTTAEHRQETFYTVAESDRLFEYFLNRSRMPGSVTWHDIAHHTLLPLSFLHTWQQRHTTSLHDFIHMDHMGVTFLPQCMLFNRLFMEIMLDKK